MRGAAPAGESIVTPEALAAYARTGKDDAVLAVEAVDSVLDVRAAAGAAALGTRSK